MDSLKTLSFDSILVNGINVAFQRRYLKPWIEDSLTCGSYELPEATLIKAAIKAGDRVVDIGAGLGYTSIVAARGGAAEIFAFEPHPHIFPALLETIRLNSPHSSSVISGLRQVVLARGGCSKSPFFLRDAFWSSSIDPNSRPFKEQILCDAVSIEEVVTKHGPEIVICDCEGHENEILSKLEHTSVRDIVVEFHGNCSDQDLTVRAFKEKARIVVCSTRVSIWFSRV